MQYELIFIIPTSLQSQRAHRFAAVRNAGQRRKIHRRLEKNRRREAEASRRRVFDIIDSPTQLLTSEPVAQAGKAD